MHDDCRDRLKVYSLCGSLGTHAGGLNTIVNNGNQGGFNDFESDRLGSTESLG